MKRGTEHHLLCMVFLLGLAFSCFSAPMTCAGETVITLPIRGNVFVRYLLQAPDGGPVKKIVLVFPGGKGVIGLKGRSDGTAQHAATGDPFVRATSFLLERSIGIALTDAPSYAKTSVPYPWPLNEPVYRDDAAQVVKDLRKRYSDAKIYLAGTGAGAVSAYFIAAGLGKELSGVILAGGDVGVIADCDPPKINIPVLVIHNVKDNCEFSSVLDAESLAARFSYAFVPIADGFSSKDGSYCNGSSFEKSLGASERFADLVAAWTENHAAPSQPETSDGAPFLNERVLWVPIEKGPKGAKLQTTVYKPDGPGPFPLIMINHGTAPALAQVGRLRFRERYVAQAREFVSRGFVVAVPMRRGYGGSPGYADMWVPSFTRYGLNDARDLRAVADYLGEHEPYVDRDRLVLFGESGGGFASLAYGSLNPPNLKGIVNFSGGMKTGDGRSDFRMADAFGEYAETTKVPSLWFYPENDTVVKLEAMRMAYKKYCEKGGQVELVVPSPFKREGHNLFYDPDGIRIWLDKVLEYFGKIGVLPKSEQTAAKPEKPAL